ncbi:MAG TPA: isopentenyl-diphosphate Delta-isomerase [Steroidobacteraceae bacterium]|nr:isopentenyl-diphosphate Delta-isomerase [Steroidobacteraceae bacterium]
MDEMTHADSLDEIAIMADLDALILVDAADRRVGHLSKALCHQGRGILHRAFSLLIFNDRGELLIQQRSPAKRLWPLYWSNSCCSHPRRSESMEAATRRRLFEELGIGCDLRFLFKFQYHAQFDATGAEHELCSVFIGQCNEPLRINRDEIYDWRWIAPDLLQRQVGGTDSSRFTPWFRLEWARIWRDHRPAVLAFRR